jgi:hypothetical protein
MQKYATVGRPDREPGLARRDETDAGVVSADTWAGSRDIGGTPISRSVPADETAQLRALPSTRHVAVTIACCRSQRPAPGLSTLETSPTDGA